MHASLEESAFERVSDVSRSGTAVSLNGDAIRNCICRDRKEAAEIVERQKDDDKPPVEDADAKGPINCVCHRREVQDIVAEASAWSTNSRTSRTLLTNPATSQLSELPYKNDKTRYYPHP
jgi:hypothetical protein